MSNLKKRARRETTSVTLYPSIRDALDTLARRHGMTRSEVLEAILLDDPRITETIDEMEETGNAEESNE